MNLITGRTGTDHVLARHDALIHRTLLGEGDYVLSYGNQIPCTPDTGTTVKIGTGALIMQGRLCEITALETVSFSVCSSTSLKRKVVIVAEYTINNQGIENVSLVAYSGNEASNTYPEPTLSYTNTSIDNGETHQMPLYALYIDGFSVNNDSTEQLFRVLSVNPMDTAMDYAINFVDELHDEVDQEITDMKERAAGVIPVITASERAPSPEDGEDGEFWVKYIVE